MKEISRPFIVTLAFVSCCLAGTSCGNENPLRTGKRNVVVRNAEGVVLEEYHGCMTVEPITGGVRMVDARTGHESMALGPVVTVSEDPLGKEAMKRLAEQSAGGEAAPWMWPLVWLVDTLSMGLTTQLVMLREREKRMCEGTPVDPCGEPIDLTLLAALRKAGGCKDAAK